MRRLRLLVVFLALLFSLPATAQTNWGGPSAGNNRPGAAFNQTPRSKQKPARRKAPRKRHKPRRPR
jgi:hypothetical protein